MVKIGALQLDGDELRLIDDIEVVIPDDVIEVRVSTRSCYVCMHYLFSQNTEHLRCSQNFWNIPSSDCKYFTLNPLAKRVIEVKGLSVRIFWGRDYHIRL